MSIPTISSPTRPVPARRPLRVAHGPEDEPALGSRRRSCTDPRGDLVLDHRRRRPEDRPVRLVLDCDHHLVLGRSPRDDLGRDRRHGVGHRAARRGVRRRLPVRRDRARRNTAGGIRLPRRRRTDAVHPPHRDDRVRERACDLDLPRSGAPHPAERRRRRFEPVLAESALHRRRIGDHLRTSRLTSVVPSPLVAIVLLAVGAIVFDLQLPTVGDMGALPTSLPRARAARRAVQPRHAAGDPSVLGHLGARRSARVVADRSTPRRPHRQRLGQEPRSRVARASPTWRPASSVAWRGAP